MRIRKDFEGMLAENLQFIASCSDAFAHPARIEMFRFIYKKNLERKLVCNSDLVAAFKYAQSTVSQHMARLTASGLIEEQSEGTKTFYYVSPGTLGRYRDLLRSLNIGF